ncbi:MAG: PAS domain S-box protein [Chloroflexota bacterium]
MAQKSKQTPRKRTKQEGLLWYFERMDQVNRAMQGKNDLEQVMKDVLDTLLLVFDCDRAWLVYPCDPDAATWQVPMERTRPEYPGVLPIGVELPLDPVGAEIYRILRNSNGPVTFGPRAAYPVPTVIAEGFRVRSFIGMALYPSIGKPWSFGLHQCSYARDWTSEEERLFQEIGRRLSDTLTSLLAYRNLQESEQQIKQLIDASPVAMIVSSGEDERVMSINDKFIEVFGYTLEDMPDVAHWWPLAYPDEKYREEIKLQWEARVRKAIKDKGQIEPMEATVTCKDGSQHYVEFRLSSIGEKHLVMFVDLTERKQAEEDLRESEEKIRTLIEQSAEGVMLADEDGNIVEWNHAYERMTGLKRRQVLGQPLWDIMIQLIAPERKTAERRESIKSGILEALRTGKSPLFAAPVEMEFYPLPSKEKRYLHQTVFPIETEKGYRIASLIEDITERKQMEEALRVSEERLQLALDAAKMGQWDWNIVSGEIVWSPQCLALYGLPPDTPMSYERFLQALHPEDRERVDAALRRAVEERASYDEMKRTIWPDGTIHWTASRGQVYCDAAGEPIRMVGVTLDISKWKEAEAQLLASEQLFRALVENSPDFVARYDRQFRRIYVNPAIQRLFTSPTESVLGKTPADQTPLYAPQIYVDHLQRAIETAAESILETPFRTAQGEMHWGQIRFVPEFGPDGEVASVLAIGRDIHEIKENERRFRMLAENFPDFVARFDRDGRHIYVNPAVEKAFGIPAEAFVGKTSHELPLLRNPEQNDVLLALIQRAFEEGIPNETEAQWDTEIGERTFEVRHVPEKDAAGNVVSVLSIAHDITDRKRAERMLQEQYSTLHGIIEGSNALIFSVDREYRYTSFNKAHAAVMQAIYGAEIQVGHSLLKYMTVAEDREKAKQNLDRALAGEHHVESAYSGEDGLSRLYFEVTHTPIRAEDDTVIGVAVFSQDVTERKRAEQEIQKLNQELEQRVRDRTAQLEAVNQELEAFAYSVSHDLRAPLRHIDGFLELLQKKTATKLDAQSQHYMETISDAAKRMGTLIDDLLSFSKMGRQEMSTVQVDLGNLVQEVIGELEPEAEGRKINWRIGDIPMATGDRAMLKVVLVNLISNALKFTRPRQQAEIEIGCILDSNTEVTVFVRDNGVGFDMDYADKLFGVFQRLHRVDEFEGTGIGLANVRRIISRHGGRTWAKGKVDGGATFFFSLPRPGKGE